MLSERMQERYDDAYEAVTKAFEGSPVFFRHRSLKKQADKTNQDISFFINEEYICGLYVAKDTYKFYTNHEKWHDVSKGDVSSIKDDGWYAARYVDLDMCISDIKGFFKSEYGIKF